MASIVSEFLNRKRVRQLSDPRNMALYIFALIVLAITWSGVKSVQKNYELQKQASVLRQENAVLELENTNAFLRNKYLETESYQELAARQNLGLAAPGEKVLLIPKNVALKYVDKTEAPAVDTTPGDSGPKGYKKNLQDWRDFLLGRRLFE